MTGDMLKLKLLSVNSYLSEKTVIAQIRIVELVNSNNAKYVCAPSEQELSNYNLIVYDNKRNEGHNSLN